MKKIVLESTSDYMGGENDVVWYTVLHRDEDASELAASNPWSGDDAVTEAKCFLMDDCVVTFRPARYENRVDEGNYNKDKYFLEISNQDASVIMSSRKVYLWADVLELAEAFKGLSFKTATRVWSVQKY